MEQMTALVLEYRPGKIAYVEAQDGRRFEALTTTYVAPGELVMIRRDGESWRVAGR